METHADIDGAWIARFRSDIEEVAKVEGQMPSPDELRSFMEDLQATVPDDAAGFDEWSESFSKLWWKRFANLETEKARHAVRLHVRLHELYEKLADGSDDDLVTYARLREHARTSASKALMALLKRPDGG